MLQMIFARRPDGMITPKPPRNRDGTPRVPDGVHTFNLAGAVEAFRMSEAELISLYDEVYGDLFPKLQDGEVGCFEPEGAKVAQTRRDLLRVVRFSHLSEPELDAVIDMCRSRGLDPWRHVWAEATVGQGGKRELKIIVTIDAMRSLADGTGRYKGQTLPYYLDEAGVWHEGVWLDKAKPPVAAKVGIRRKGFDEPQFAIAKWDSYVQMVETPRGPEVSDFWVKMGPEQLAKCAEALAFKKTFAKALGALLTREEMDQSHNPPPPRRAAPAQHTPPGEVVIDDETPCSWKEFDQVLSQRFGLADDQVRREAIARLREKLGGSTAAVPKMFFARALRELQDSPQLYGVKLNAA